MNVVPKPSLLTPTAKRYELKRGSAYFADPAFCCAEAALTEALTAAGFPIEKGNEDAPLRVIRVQDPTLDDSGYMLDVTESGVTISANTDTGAFYGVMTFRQIARLRFCPAAELVLQCCHISDAPQKDSRRLILNKKIDVNIAAELIREMAYVKLNELSLAFDANTEYAAALSEAASKCFVKIIINSPSTHAKIADFSHPYRHFRLKKLYLGSYAAALLYSDDDKHKFDFFNYPRIQAFAESAWSDRSGSDYFNFETRLQQLLQEQDMDGIYHCKPHLFRKSLRYTRHKMKKALSAAYAAKRDDTANVAAILADETQLNEYENLI